MFYNKLESMGLGHLVGYKMYKHIVPNLAHEVYEAIRDAIKNNHKIMIDPDTDPDGFMSGLVVKDTFDALNYYNYEVNKPEYKRHGIPEEEVNRAIAEGFNLVIIVDSSTNSMEHINTLTKHGIKVIIIDHHQPEYKQDEYLDDTIILNSLHPDQPKELECVSACFLTTLVMQYVLNQYQSTTRNDWLVYSLTSLYSDSMNLAHPYNATLIHHRQDLLPYVPDWILMFMNQWDEFNRSFIEYKMVPRINALVRMADFDTLYTMFYGLTQLTRDEQEKLFERIEDNYQLARTLTTNLADYATLTHEENFIIANLDKACAQLKVENTLARNFTGVVSSKIMNKYNLPVVTLISTSRDKYQGSVRDPFNRDLLNIFRRVMQSGGHKSAFGVEVDKNNLTLAKQKLTRYKEQFNQVESNSLLVDAESTLGELNLIQSIAEYNELSGGIAPVAYLVKTVTHDMRIYPKEKYVSVKWGQFYLTVFLDNVSRMDRLMIKPMIKKDGLSMIVNSILE